MAGTKQSEQRKASEDAVLKRTQDKRKSNKSRIKRLEEADAPYDMIRALKKKNKGTSKFQDKILDPKKRTIELTKEYRETIPKAMGGYKSGGLALKGYGKAYMKGGKVK